MANPFDQFDQPDDRAKKVFDRFNNGELTEEQMPIYNELKDRGAFDRFDQPVAEPAGRAFEAARGIARPTKAEPLTIRQQMLAELAEETGPLEAFLVGAGRGFYNIARGVGLAEPATPEEREALGALREERPYATGAGEITGEAAPFLVPGTAAARLASVPARLAATGLVGGAEGAIIQRGLGEDVTRGAAVGAGVGIGAEIFFPVLGKLGGKVVRRITGRTPRGAMIDAAGQPTEELQEALDAAGISFDDLTQDAVEFITKQRPGAMPEQVARGAAFAEEGITPTRGELTRGFEQLATEQRLIESAADIAAEPLRQFKLKQSEAVKESLRRNFDIDVATEETGQLIKDALTGRKELLRTQKNDLYKIASEKAKDMGGVPIFTDSIQKAVPDEDLFEDLAITAPQSIKSLDQILTKYGIKEPTQEAVAAGFEPVPLTIDNFERFRKTLNSISRGDQTGAADVAIGPIREALDTELAELGTVLQEKGVSENIVKPLLEARKIVRRLKTEFSPQSITGRITGVKKDGVTPVIEASKIYDRIIGRTAPVEETRRIIKALSKSKDGESALASLQASTIMDLIDAGFGTESRKISGIKIFNPTAFKRRLKTISDDKLKALFINNKKSLKKIKNIDRIASDLIPPAGAIPKGSASVVLDLANKLGLAGISAKVPGGPLLIGSLRAIAEPVKKGVEVQKAMRATPEVRQLISQFPGIVSAVAIPAILEEE
jgi:hypothetical protein